MFSVPGKYSGGKTSKYTWTQTLNEVEIKAPIPASASCKCAFTAKALDLSFATKEETEPIAVGDLTAVIAASDCLWSVERDAAGGAVAVVSLQKAVPQVWNKLFAADAEPEEAPAF